MKVPTAIAAQTRGPVEMPNYTCPSCRQTFHASDDPDGKCIFCGASLRDFRPDHRLVSMQHDLRGIAIGQRWMIISAVFALTGQALFIFGPSLVVGRFVITWVELLPTFALMYGVGRLLHGMGDPEDKILFCCLLMLLPVLNVIGLVVFNSAATQVLRQANLEVGVLGASTLMAEAAMDSSLCSTCGYNLTGNQSGRCPECGTHVRR